MPTNTVAKTGAELIADERQRQIEVHGWTLDLNDENGKWGELITAARCYLKANDALEYDEESEYAKDLMETAFAYWPWRGEGASKFKPSKDPVRNLQKAAALIAAEMDRLQRL